MTSLSRPLATIDADLDRLADELLPLALGSLHYAALYVAARGLDSALCAARMSDEQAGVLDRIVACRVVRFAGDIGTDDRRDWMDAEIERIRDHHPLLTHYWDLHQLRATFLPAIN